MSQASPLLIHDAAELVTWAPLVREGRRTRLTAADLGRVVGPAWIAMKDGKIEAVGSGAPPSAYTLYKKMDARGALVMPGLVDSHTHPIFAGTRAPEFARRLSGATYQEIAASGGGIRSTMRATREATDDELLALTSARFQRMLRLGVTTIEAKSGYGLSVKEELRLLRVLNRAAAKTAQTVSITCLALHAASPEFKTLRDYANACATELLPEVAREKLAFSVDAFIDAGYFTVDDCERYVAKARELGLAVRVHADEFSDAGAAQAAARWGAVSADHLQFAPPEAIDGMAKANVVAVVLPGTSLYTKIPFTNARAIADRGCAVAVATDFNPGSCRIDNLALVATVAAVQGGLRPVEAMAGVTYVAAAALGLEGRKGALVAGYDADVLVTGVSDVDEWLADFGATAPRAVVARGALV